MQSVTFILLAGLAAMALAEGQFYVPRAYYTIDPEGHASAPVPLRRLRRSLSPYPYSQNYGGAGSSASANANAVANSNGWGDSSSNANANARASSGGWALPPGVYGASNPALRAGQYRYAAGPIFGAHSVVAQSSVGLDSSGKGYYDQYTGVSN